MKYIVSFPLKKGQHFAAENFWLFKLDEIYEPGLAIKLYCSEKPKIKGASPNKLEES